VFLVSGPVLRLPLVASVPLQPPPAVHEAALVELQTKVADAPELSAAGVALRLAVGMTLMPALTTVLLESLPEQVNMKTEFCVSGRVVWVPERPTFPLQASDATQAVALVEDQVRVAVPPLTTAPVLVFKLTVGASAANAAPLPSAVTNANAYPA